MGFAAGTNFGPYRIIGPLGRGGMASVYRAYEPALDRYVAVKVLPAEAVQDESSAERFRREAKVIARLEHPNIIPIFAYGIEEGSPWMAMRLVAGGSLAALLKGQRLPAERSVGLLRGVADALDYAHGKGVVHRDVKPQNVLLDESERVYLADFGIARLSETATVLTAAGLITGTPQYMAPEQATGKSVDSRADIYALGVVAYEMLAGRVPFAADTPVAVLMKHVSEPIPIPAPAEVPEPLTRALLKALAKAPEDRWPTAGDFARALQRGLTEAPAPAPTVAVTSGAGTALGSAPTMGGSGTVPPTSATTFAPHVPTTVARPAHASAPPTPIRRRSAVPLLLAGGGLTVAVLAALALRLLPTRQPPPSSVTPASLATPVTVAPVFGPATTLPALPLPAPTSSAAPRSRPTIAPIARPPAVALRPPLSAVRTEAPTVTSTLPPPPPAPTASLRLDVDAVLPALGEPAAVLFLQVRVDDRPLRTLTLTFEGRDALTRSRKRQVFEVSGIPVGTHRVGVVASRSQDLSGERAEGATQMTFEEGSNRAYVQVRFAGAGDSLVRFR